MLTNFDSIILQFCTSENKLGTGGLHAYSREITSKLLHEFPYSSSCLDGALCTLMFFASHRPELHSLWLF